MRVIGRGSGRMSPRAALGACALFACALFTAPLAGAQTDDGAGDAPDGGEPFAFDFSDLEGELPEPFAFPEPEVVEAAPDETPQERMDRLFSSLKEAPTEEDADFIAEEIEALWRAELDPTARLLIERAQAAALAGSAVMARQLADGAVALSGEDGVQALVRSAEIAVLSDDFARAVRDLEAAIIKDPRRYDAYMALAAVLERMEAWRGAYQAYGEVLALYPENGFAKQRHEDLGRQVSGRVL